VSKGAKKWSSSHLLVGRRVKHRPEPPAQFLQNELVAVTQLPQCVPPREQCAVGERVLHRVHEQLDLLHRHAVLHLLKDLVALRLLLQQPNHDRLQALQFEANAVKAKAANQESISVASIGIESLSYQMHRRT